jgi:DNA-binding SARP family transcriptional activator/ABC-type transport system substrate-binding protein/outer membrane protein assembly factor BamB
MEFRLLGPVEARRDDRPIALGGAKPRALLALLLLHANEVVSRDRLIDALWSDRAPGAAEHSLDVQVSRLRKALTPDELLVRRSGGYVLEVEPEQIDARRFERLLQEGRRANAAGRPSDAVEVLDRALGLWHGYALADVAYEDFARAESDRLEELRLAATEERVDARLALGEHDALIAELAALAAKHPLRERLRGQQMVALYRAGRQAEALRVYSDFRTRLADELGLEPGQALKDLEQAILRQDPGLGRSRTTIVARRRRLAAGAAALALAGLAVAAAVLATQGGAESAQALADADSNVFLSADTGTVVAEADVRDSVGVRFGAGSLWSVSSEGLLTRVDPETGEIEATIGLGILKPGGLTFGAGLLWVTDHYSPLVLRVDPAVNEVVEPFQLPEEGLGTVFTGDVAVGAGSVWVGHGGYNPGAFVERLDLETGRPQDRYSILGGDADHLAFSDGVLWVGSTPSGEVRRIEPGTNTPRKVARLDGEICCIAAGDGAVWVATRPDNLVWKLDEVGTQVRSFKLPSEIKGISYGDGALWAAVGEDGTVVRIDAATSATRTLEVRHHVHDVAVRDGLVAAAVQESAADVTAGLSGDVVWVGRKEESLFDSGAATDPAFTFPTWDAPQLQFHYATCARLLNYPDAEGEAGRTLVPEVAEDFPEVSADGRTYTFRIRKGFRFSPPSDEEVTAKSFKRAAERGMSPQMDPFSDRLAPGLDNIVGAETYHSGEASHVSGITARGDELVIRLRKPAPEFPWLAALSCAVPVDTPVVPYGLDTPIASAGPYYLAAHTGSVAVLKPNPNYGGSRPQHLDALVYRMGVAPGDAAAQIEAGTLDYYLESQRPTLTAETPAAREAGNRYRMTADGSAGTHFLVFNWDTRPLFADIRMRRAVQYILDRSKVPLPATRIASPKSPDYDQTPLYPLQGDAAKARSLAGGRTGRVVVLTWTDDPYANAFNGALREKLARIGLTMSVLPLVQGESEEEWLAKARRSDLLLGGISAHSADQVEYLKQLFLPPDLAAELDRIAKLSSPERERAAAALAKEIDARSLFAVFEHTAVPELVSKRLGCIVHQPQYAGVDLAALCLKE